MYDLFNMLLDSVCQNFVKDFCIYVHQCYWLVILCVCVCVESLTGFGIRVMVASQNEFGFTFLCSFLEEFEQDRYQLCFKFLVEFSCEAIWSWAFVCWKISDYSLISVLVVGLLRFSISSWFSFGKLYFSKNLSISSKLSILLAYSC